MLFRLDVLFLSRCFFFQKIVFIYKIDLFLQVFEKWGVVQNRVNSDLNPVRQNTIHAARDILNIDV
jgi:hypothetical protein